MSEPRTREEQTIERLTRSLEAAILYLVPVEQAVAREDFDRLREYLRQYRVGLQTTVFNAALDISHVRGTRETAHEVCHRVINELRAERGQEPLP